MPQNVKARGPLKIAILEDETIIQQRLSRILRASSIVDTVECYSDNASFLGSNKLENLDILLADIGLPDGPGTQSISAISEKNPECLSIAISSNSDATTVIKAVTSGAVGYLHKDDDASEIMHSIQLALDGKSPISPSIARLIVSTIQAPQSITGHTRSNIPSPSEKDALTNREVEVLEVLSKGLSYSETADHLGISENTLPVHVKNIYRKLHSHNRTEALSAARDKGILK